MGEHTMWKSQRCRRIFISFLPILVIAGSGADVRREYMHE